MCLSRDKVDVSVTDSVDRQNIESIQLCVWISVCLYFRNVFLNLMFWTQSERVECCTCLHHCLSVWFDPRTWHVFKKPFLFQPFSIGFNSCRQMGIECEFKLDNVHTTVRNSDSRVWGLRIWTIPSKMACWIFRQEWLTGTSYFKSLSLSLNLSFFSLVCQLCWTAGNH